MSSIRSFLQAFNIIDDESMASNITSLVTDIRTKDQICIHIVSDNTSAVGQWSVEASIDNLTWVPIEFSPIINNTLTGVDDDVMIDMKLLSFTYIRVVWTGSGVGTANVTISAKGN